MLVLTGKVENNHREPGQKACGEGVVPGAGIEPAQPQGREILSLLCLPIPPSGRCDQLYLPRNERKGKCIAHFPFDIWSGRRVSNSRPIPWQGIALPTELLPLGSFSGAARHGGKTRRESKDSRPPARRIIRMPAGAVNPFQAFSRRFFRHRPTPWPGAAVHVDRWPAGYGTGSVTKAIFTRPARWASARTAVTRS